MTGIINIPEVAHDTDPDDFVVSYDHLPVALN